MQFLPAVRMCIEERAASPTRTKSLKMQKEHRVILITSLSIIVFVFVVTSQRSVLPPKYPEITSLLAWRAWFIHFPYVFRHVFIVGSFSRLFIRVIITEEEIRLRLACIIS